MLTLKPTSKKDTISIRKFPLWYEYGDTTQTWSQCFPAGVWFPLNVSGTFKVYSNESYDVVDFTELKLKSKAIIKDSVFIDKVYNDGVEVISQDGYFYGDKIKFNGSFTGVLYVFYPSGFEGYVKNLIFQFRAVQPIHLSRISKVKRVFYPEGVNSFLSYNKVSTKREFKPINVNEFYSVDTYRILKKFYTTNTQELYKVRAFSTLISEYWNFYSYWTEFRNDRWISYLDPASY